MFYLLLLDCLGLFWLGHVGGVLLGIVGVEVVLVWGRG